VEPIETERLIIRSFVMQDLAAIHPLVFADPQVAWLNGKAATRAQTRQWLGEHVRDAGRSFGSFAIVRKEDQALVGLVALEPYLADFVRFPDDPHPRFNSIEVELGYALGPAYWGNGYVTEAGLAMIDYAFSRLRLSRIVNSVRSANIRSINVMKRLGFRVVPNAHPRWSSEVLGILDNARV